LSGEFRKLYNNRKFNVIHGIMGATTARLAIKKEKCAEFRELLGGTGISQFQ